MTLTAEHLYQGFRDADKIARARDSVSRLAADYRRPVRIMEVCGGHTFAIVKYGLDQLLPAELSFIHGPGCPVCVLPQHRIDAAIALARLPEVILVTLGDLIRVPGRAGSLQQARAAGADVRAVYSPLEALKIACDNPERQVVYFAIGFETTAPMTALLIDQCRAEGLTNLFFHINHVLIPPAMAMILDQGGQVDAFIAPGHVSVITGLAIYQPLVRQHRTPMIVAGFEPLDILHAIERILQQLLSGDIRIENGYSRSVADAGNPKARQLCKRYFETRASFPWRGIGPIEDSALQLRGDFAALDAEVQFAKACPPAYTEQPSGCICGQILTGHAQPGDCPLFAEDCTPRQPQGSCMVSNEGACAAYYRYRRQPV